jgi:hypothetical protein
MVNDLSNHLKESSGRHVSDNSDTHQRDALISTDVSLYLGDCTGDSLKVLCDGTSERRIGSMWSRALHALVEPSPRGPYAVASRFTIFIHEIRDDSLADSCCSVTFRVNVFCKGAFAYASVQMPNGGAYAMRTPFVIGDDVVTVARRIFLAAS